MTDIQLDDDIPMCVDLSLCKYKTEKFPWIAMFLMAFTCSIIGFGAGWAGGYVMGVKDATIIIEEVFDEVKDNTITEGHMPW
jgi:hypothetical protein